MDSKTTMILQAQKEVRDHTNDSLVMPIIAVFDDLYEQSVKRDGRIKTFQVMLREIPNWSQLKVASTASLLKASCNCLSELISALFLSHIKILSSIKNAKMANVKVKIPKQDKFIHAVLIESAKQFYENPLIFRSKDTPAKEEVVMKSIETTVRKFLPLKDILGAYLKSKADTLETLEGDPDHDKMLQTPLARVEDSDAEEEEEEGLVDEVLDQDDEEEEVSEEETDGLPAPPPRQKTPVASTPSTPVVPQTKDITIVKQGAAQPPPKKALFDDHDLVEDV